MAALVVWFDDVCWLVVTVADDPDACGFEPFGLEEPAAPVIWAMLTPGPPPAQDASTNVLRATRMDVNGNFMIASMLHGVGGGEDAAPRQGESIRSFFA